MKEVAGLEATECNRLEPVAVLELQYVQLAREMSVQLTTIWDLAISSLLGSSGIQTPVRYLLRNRMANLM